MKKGAVLARARRCQCRLRHGPSERRQGERRGRRRARGRRACTYRKLVASGSIGDAELVRARARKAAAAQRVQAAGAHAALSGEECRRRRRPRALRRPHRRSLDRRAGRTTPSMKVVTLLDVSTLRLKLFVPRIRRACGPRGQDVSFTVSSAPGKTFTGRVRYVGPQLPRHQPRARRRSRGPRTPTARSSPAASRRPTSRWASARPWSSRRARSARSERARE